MSRRAHFHASFPSLVRPGGRTHGWTRNASRWSGLQAGPRHGYTLIELVAVIGLVVVLLSLALGGYLAWSQTTALAAAEDAILSSLARAREHAISRRQQTTLVLTNAALVQTRSAACFIFAHDEDGRERPLGPTNALPAGIAFSNSLCASRFSFRPDGACADDGDWGNLTRRTVTLFHVGRRRQPLARNIEVDRLTGLARPLARGEEP